MVGETLSHYRILERIGAGGMGVVYLARDERLDRDVAVKVLAAEVVGDPGAASRFRREARALSRLNHPNIASVYDFDTQAGVSFLAMEYVSGRPLSDVIQGPPLAEADLLNLALQLADGLVAAHREGIVHRDLKPGNLRLTSDGRLKILDFGLAKFAAPADGTTQTTLETQAVAGTLPYMAPEQLRGGAVDARTDIYAGGVVMYELATGRRPFAEPVTAELIDGVLNRQPIAPGRVRPDLSPVLDGIILKCLEKDPAFRYQSATELIVDLKRHAARSTAGAPVAAPAAASAPPRTSRARVAARVALPMLALVAVAAATVALNVLGLRDWLLGGPRRIQSLAVLPFDNFSHDPSQQYFVDGMTETLTTHLAQITSIRVIGRASAMQFAAERKPPIREIARALGVDAVVEGSVLREGSRVRITAQLVSANPEGHVWSNTYDRDLRDILQVHSEVSQAIAREIRARLSPDEQTRLSRARPVNPEAYQAYLQGRQAFMRLGPQNMDNALASLNRAISLDPSFAPAYSSLAFAQMWHGMFRGLTPPRSIASQVRAAAAKALELDPSLGEALAVEGTLNLYFDWDWATASVKLKRAIEVGPSEALLYHPYADYLLVQGKLDESLDYCRRGAALDPLSPAVTAVVAGHLIFLRRFDEAIALLDRIRALSPDAALIGVMRSNALWEKGDYPAAIAQWAAIPGPVSVALKGAYAEAGPKSAARAVARIYVESSRSQYVNPLTIATWFARAGDVQPALEWLEKSYEEHVPFLLHIKADPAFDSVRGDRRFQDIVRRIGFPDARADGQRWP